MSDGRTRTFSKALGPGLLFAGAAVGVSHLVQCTRAGAMFGLGLLVFVVLANIFKYPAFQFGPRYSAATGTSILQGYRRQGKWALVLYLMLTLGTMLTVQAAVTFLTAGLLQRLLGVALSPVLLTGLLLGLVAGLLAIGRYPLLDKLIKVAVALLTVATLFATALTVPHVDWSGPWLLPEESWTPTTLLLVAGLIGWMPSAIDVAVWHSLWTLARRAETKHAPAPREALIDFNIGYVGTALLAICFVILGAGVMHGSGEPIEIGASAFAGQILRLYTETLEPWTYPFIATAAFGVMFSTTLTVVDGFPRALSRLYARFRSDEDPEQPAEEPGVDVVYWGSLAFIGAGSLIIMSFFATSLLDLVSVATLLSFLTAPVLAWLNHRAMFSEDVPAEHRPTPGMRVFSWSGVAFNSCVAAGYLYLIAS